MNPVTLSLRESYFDALILGLVAGNARLLEELDENYQRLFPIVFMYDANSRIQTEEELADTTEKLREFYFKKEAINEETLNDLEKVYL